MPIPMPMSATPTSTTRVVVVHRLTERQDIVRAAGTWGQAAYGAKLRGASASLSKVQKQHDQTEDALQSVSSAIPSSWRRGAVERADLDRFLFEPDDIIVIVGPDGLVANTAKYLTGRSFFPHLISKPFGKGLTEAFYFAAGACVLGAVASLLRGGKFHYAEPGSTTRLTGELPVLSSQESVAESETLLVD